MVAKAPGKSHREGVTIMQLADIFPTDEEARKWFEAKIWPNGRHCPRCGSTRTSEAKHRHMPYWCTDCRSYFSVKTGSVMEKSPLPLRKWVYAIYLHMTSLKGVSSMKLHRDIGVTQKTAWFMLQRIREAFDNDDEPPFAGPSEADETFVGGKRKNMSNSKRKELAGTGRGGAGKAAVVGVKDRETNQVRVQHVPATDMQHVAGFVALNAQLGTTVYTDDAAVYDILDAWYDHETVKHSVGEYVRDMAHTNGIESFWSMLKRAYVGTYHKMSEKHLQRYVTDFAGRHNVREHGTMGQMASIASGMAGKRLTYAALIADNGLASGARS
ncbi:MAG: IS1595 family transposase [Rhodospirillales bacterium]|nr:IS1595 family transposase [Rhodospirillales bacterium]